VKSIYEACKKALYIELNSRQRQPRKGQEETNKTKGKMIAATIQKGKDPNRHCKHYDVDGHTDEKFWKHHPELHPRWCQSKKRANAATERFVC
jgi:hypothetical protein